MPAGEEVKKLLDINKKNPPMFINSTSVKWCFPNAAPPDYGMRNAGTYMGLNGVKKLDWVFASNLTFPQRTFFLLNGEPLLNPDGSVLLVEWEGGPDRMVQYTLDLDIPEFKEKGVNLLQSVTLPLVTDEYYKYYSISLSDKYSLELNGRFVSTYYGGYTEEY